MPHKWLFLTSHLTHLQLDKHVSTNWRNADMAKHPLKMCKLGKDLIIQKVMHTQQKWEDLDNVLGKCLCANPGIIIEQLALHHVHND